MKLVMGRIKIMRDFSNFAEALITILTTIQENASARIVNHK